MNSENPESTLTASRGLGGKRLGEISELNPILCILTFAFFAFFCGKMFLLKITEGGGFLVAGGDSKRCGRDVQYCQLKNF